MSKSSQSDQRKKLALLLAEQRKAKGMTQVALARAMGRHQPFIANIESAERRLDVIELLEICEILDADFDALISQIRA
jgi:transcriptional regulator with XRE-family HTH domain